MGLKMYVRILVDFLVGDEDGAGGCFELSSVLFFRSREFIYFNFSF